MDKLNNMQVIDMVVSFSLSDFFSLIGCFTGLCGFFLSLFLLWRERYRLKIDFTPTECIFFNAVTNKKYTSSKQAIIHMTFRNPSVSPLTIHDAYLLVDKHYTRFENYTDSECIVLPDLTPHKEPHRLMEQKNYTKIPMDRQLHLPLRLEARDSMECIGFIPFFPCDSEALSVKVTIVLKTAVRKKHKINFTLQQYCKEKG